MEDSSLLNRALLMEDRALLMEYRALLMEDRALLIEDRALLIEYKALLMEDRALLIWALSNRASLPEYEGSIAQAHPVATSVTTSVTTRPIPSAVMKYSAFSNTALLNRALLNRILCRKSPKSFIKRALLPSQRLTQWQRR